ncbi:hypothetical protein GCM10011354_30420 [Egicoccus halophilus]|uniref:Uncharacterized protein n=1 Tax=Egicoccus halophilus TaxID=1670830 RepID=A0A8J3EVR8_9ACTN|nr:hypothetical protein GCM10011354_30420 [Egicoccus halophilus]
MPLAHDHTGEAQLLVEFGLEVLGGEIGRRHGCADRQRRGAATSRKLPRIWVIVVTSVPSEERAHCHADARGDVGIGGT